MNKMLLPACYNQMCGDVIILFLKKMLVVLPGVTILPTQAFQGKSQIIKVCRSSFHFVHLSRYSTSYFHIINANSYLNTVHDIF